MTVPDNSWLEAFDPDDFVATAAIQVDVGSVVHVLRKGHVLPRGTDAATVKRLLGLHLVVKRGEH